MHLAFLASELVKLLVHWPLQMQSIEICFYDSDVMPQASRRRQRANICKVTQCVFKVYMRSVKNVGLIPWPQSWPKIHWWGISFYLIDFLRPFTHRKVEVSKNWTPTITVQSLWIGKRSDCYTWQSQYVDDCQSKGWIPHCDCKDGSKPHWSVSLINLFMAILMMYSFSPDLSPTENV